MNLSNMSAYGAQINLKLLNDIVAFVFSAAKATYAQKQELQRLCLFPLSIGQSNADAMQRDYGFLYLGEMLERYEERFGMTVQDRRAIALALGYTREIATPEMFVGSQRVDFIQSVQRNAEHDIYLTGALYLIHAGESTSVIIENRIKEWAYTQTEELIFAMSLFPDGEQVLDRFGGQLVNLLGKGRTLPIFGNTDIFNYAFAMLFPLKKRMKARSMNLLRALLSLPVSFVKEGGKHHDWLLEHGYTPIEIAYANMAALGSQCVPGGPGRDSITAEKLVVGLFRTVLAYDKALPDEVYQQLSQIYQRYSKFDVKCYGEHQLANTLRDSQIQTPETMAWFIGCCDNPLHSATLGFDIMDTKWDALVHKLDAKSYQKLFESCLSEELNTAQIQERLDRYQTLTQKDYLTCYSEDAYIGKFSLLVNAGIIDLWAAFQSCLSEGGATSQPKPKLLQHIKVYCRGVTTSQAFEFLKQFLHQYGYQGRKLYFGRDWYGFESELWNEERYGGKIALALQRDFLADDPLGQRLLLHWVDEYFFTEKPKYYLAFAQAVLEDETVAALLSPEDQRGIFDVLISQSKLSTYDAGRLKERYLTPEEQQAEQQAKEAAAVEAERQKQLDMVQNIESCYAGSSGTFGAVVKFLNQYRYYNDREEIARRVARDGLEQLLQDNGYALRPDEAGHFLDVCRELVSGGALGWAELQSYILKVKEVKRDDPDSDPDE